VASTTRLKEFPEPIAGLCFLDDFLLAWREEPPSSEGPAAARARVCMHLGSFEYYPQPMVV